MTVQREWASAFPAAAAVSSRRAVSPGTRASFLSRASWGWIVLHVILGVVVRTSPTAAAVHGLAALGVGFIWALKASEGRVAAAIAYLAASQVLWRMCSAPLPFMYANYAVVLIALLAALRFRRKPSLISLLYFLPLLPSAFLTVSSVLDAERARQLVTFNLAGPASHFVLAWLFSASRLPSAWGMARAMLGPMAATVTGALWFLGRQESVRFGTESNFAASGGFGPNQVASVLSLGLLLLFAHLWINGRRAWRPTTWLLLVVLGVETLLTFSRSGIAMALGAGAAMTVSLFRKPGVRFGLLVSAGLLWAFAVFVLIPRLNAFTGGAFEKRYTNPSLSNREQIAKSDLQLFRERPFLGVGPGMGTELRERMMGMPVAAHTEFSRVLAEHGLGGVISLLALVLLSWKAYHRARSVSDRAWRLGLIVWAGLYFSVNAFRLALPGVALIMAMVGIGGGPESRRVFLGHRRKQVSPGQSPFTPLRRCFP